MRVLQTAAILALAVAPVAATAAPLFVRPVGADRLAARAWRASRRVARRRGRPRLLAPSPSARVRRGSGRPIDGGISLPRRPASGRSVMKVALTVSAFVAALAVAPLASADAAPVVRPFSPPVFHPWRDGADRDAWRHRHHDFIGAVGPIVDETPDSSLSRLRSVAVRRLRAGVRQRDARAGGRTAARMDRRTEADRDRPRARRGMGVCRWSSTAIDRRPNKRRCD